MPRSIDRLVDQIVHSYASIGGINHINGPNLPSMESVVRIIADLESLIFPGYKSADALRETNLRFVTGETVNRLVRALQSEIFKSLCFKQRLEDPESGGYCKETEAARLEAMDQAEILTFEIIDCIPELRRRIKLDVEAAFEGGFHIQFDAAAELRDAVNDLEGQDLGLIHGFEPGGFGLLAVSAAFGVFEALFEAEALEDLTL